MPPEPFFLRYENYVSPTPGPEIFEIDAEGPGPPVLRRQSWQRRPGGAVQQRVLDAADVAEAAHLVLHELDFFAIPAEVGLPASAATPAGDWPLFTLRARGRQHACGGHLAGRQHPGLGRVQALFLRLYETYFLPLY